MQYPYITTSKPKTIYSPYQNPSQYEIAILPSRTSLFLFSMFCLCWFWFGERLDVSIHIHTSNCTKGGIPLLFVPSET